MSKVYEIVQDKIIKAMEEAIENGGTAPWRKPWVGGIPKNYLTKKHYRGINLLLLGGGSYLTLKQIKELAKKDPKIKLKKGSKSEMVVFWSFVDKKDKEKDSEEDNSYAILRYYKVFHISNVEGIEEEETQVFEHEPIDRAELLLNKYKEEVSISVQKSNKAYYVPALDKIVLPELNQFERSEEFYSTAFHEIVHSTGHESRLSRFHSSDQVNFGSDSYSKEELVAEIGSNMILSSLCIENEQQQENSVSYLYGWLKAIKKDPKLITLASQKAQKAADYILAFIEEKEKEKEKELEEAV